MTQPIQANPCVTAAKSSRLLNPRSVAVVGASGDLARPGSRVVLAMRRIGFTGEVHPISQSSSEIGGYPTSPSLDAVVGDVDLLVIVVRAEAVPGVLRSGGERGIRNAVILSSGFRETGTAGARLEDEIAAIAAAYSMDVLGPNCLGFVDLQRQVAASFTTALDDLPHARVGKVVLVSQSGAMGAAIFGLAQSERVGISSFVSTGNETVLGFRDIVDRVVADAPPPVLLGYVEGLSDGRALVRSLRSAREAGTKVAILKVGTTEAGQRAAISHTGALSGSDRVWDAAFLRSGAYRATSPTDLLDLAMAFGLEPAIHGRRVAILSMSGGAGVMMSDRAGQLHLEVPPPSPATCERLSKVMPGFSALANPIDFGGVYTDPAALLSIVGTVLDDNAFDAVALFLGLTPSLAGRFEKGLADLVRETGKPVVVSWLGGPREGLNLLREVGIPTTSDPVRAMDLIAASASSTAPLPEDGLGGDGARYCAALAALEPSTSVTMLSEDVTRRLLAEAGITFPRQTYVRTQDEAAKAGHEIGTRLVVKVDAPGLAHKSDIGGVALGVECTAAAAAFTEVVAAAERVGYAATGAVVAQMVADEKVELLVGSRWDAQFGAVVVVGAGGTHSEIDDDVCVDLAPVSEVRAREMIASLRCASVLNGFRGGPAFDVEAAAGAVAAVSELAAGLGPELRELDINPLAVLVGSGGCVALDAVAIVHRSEVEDA